MGKFTVDESFQLCQRKSRLGGGESRQKFGKIRSASLILGKASRPLMVFNHRYQMVGDFGGAERTVATCPCPALLSRISATRRKRSAFATDVPPNFNTRMVVTSLPLVEKPALSGAGFFCVSCTRQPAPLPVVMVMVMVVLMRFMDVVYSVIFICLCAMPILVKVFSDLSQ